MQKKILIFMCALAMNFSAYAQDVTTYLQHIPDVPLLPQMVELEDEALVFDKAEGRVVESAVYTDKIDENQALGFYKKVLPELGWQAVETQRFLRNDEQLIVKWEKVQGGGIIRFWLSPKPGQKQEKNF